MIAAFKVPERKEYIEREAAIDCLHFVCVPQCRQYAQEEIKKLPAADVVPVVFCGECKNYGARDWDGGKTGICTRTDAGVSASDFCSYGAKMEEG